MPKVKNVWLERNGPRVRGKGADCRPCVCSQIHKLCIQTPCNVNDVDLQRFRLPEQAPLEEKEMPWPHT